MGNWITQFTQADMAYVRVFQEILRYAQQGKYYNLTLNVWNCNTSAMKFYESLGLKPQKITMETVL